MTKMYASDLKHIVQCSFELMSVDLSCVQNEEASLFVFCQNCGSCLLYEIRFLSLHRSVLALHARLRDALLALSRSVFPSNRAARAQNRAILV